MILETIHNSFNHIWFNDKNHRYYNKRVKKYLKSSTGIKKKFVKPFDAESILPYSAKKKGVSVAKLRKEWNYLRRFGVERGNYVHDFLQHASERRFIFNELNLLNEDVAKILEVQCRNYIKDFSDYVHVRSELVIGNDYVGGMMDRLLWNDGLILHDYKTDKDIYKQPYGNLLDIFSDLEDTLINQYRIQTSIYKRIFEEETGLKIKEIKIIWFSENITEYQIIDIEPLNLDKLWQLLPQI